MTLAVTPEVVVEPTPPAGPVVAKKRRRRPKIGLWFGIAWLGGLAFCALFSSVLPFVYTYDAKLKVGGRTGRYNLGPGFRAWFGTDSSSHDVFSRCIYAARVTLEIGVLATVIGLMLGGLLGIACGYFQGWTDRLGSIITDSLLALPPLLLALLLVFRMDDLKNAYSWLGWLNRQWEITLTLGILAIAPFARIARAQTIALRDREFVLAARSLGAKSTRVIWREIVPNLIPAMLTVAVTGLGILVAAEGALAFLGLGVQRPLSWGKMISDGQRDLARAWWATIFPCIFLFLTVISFNLIGDRLARRFDIREAAI
ncbi:MAG: Dipeptide transporter rane component of superfamily [Ilumatobacteraceae bacterium]|nr:Dipeptide transporter rane component of superfamily [Ilumatobacteraceae bacterium]